MKCQLIQTTKIADDNRAEKEMLAFLKNLPGDYFVYRELQITADYRRRVRGMKKKKPDFVVVSRETGLLSIEVKDWNLTRSVYEWRDQHTILVRRSTGEVKSIENPMLQVDAYLHALMELLSGLDIYVTSTLAFPRVSRSDFLNKLQNIDVLRNPQSRFYLDLDRTLFKEDLDRHVAYPERLLLAVVQKDKRHHPSSSEQIENANKKLLPSSFRIGDFTQRQKNQRRLKMITEEQQRWIFGLDRHENYLLDVAGSGKTNALISKAIHIVDQAGSEASTRILLTTYNHNLEKNIQRIFRHKIADSPDREWYQTAITIQCIPCVMENIVITVLGIDSIAAYKTPGESPAAYEDRLREDVKSILSSDRDRFRRFDYVFIDEIQDFDDFLLIVTEHLGKSKNFFFVGDIGQKIYERSHHLSRLGFITERVELKKSYKMFRTPRYIAELATRFIMGDPLSQQEFKACGYSESFKYPNKLKNMVEILLSAQPEEEIAEKVEDLLNTVYSEEDIMIITSEARLAYAETALRAAGISYTLGESEHEAVVSLVDFMNVKGLEKEVVFVTGIEDLYDRSKPQGMFDDEAEKRRKELFSRRKVYVSLTRPLEQLIVYYRDGSNRFILELLAINREITSRRQGGSYAL